MREATAKRPLMPPRVFRSAGLVAANAIQVLSAAGMFGMFFLGALYLRRVLGYDALQIGLAFLPVTVSMGLLSIRYSERLVTRFGARALLVPGLALIGAGLIVFSQSPVHATYLLNVMPAMTLLGIGGGIGRAPGFAESVTTELDQIAPVMPAIRVSALGTDAVTDGCLAAGTELAWGQVMTALPTAGSGDGVRPMP